MHTLWDTHHTQNVIGNDNDMNRILIYITFLFATSFGYSQDKELLYENNEFTLTYVKVDSLQSIIQTTRYHDHCHNFGTFDIHNDTITFTENIDTFLLIEPIIFYDFNADIPVGSIKLESRFSFWQAPEWQNWLFDVNYQINNDIDYECANVYENQNDNHTLIIPIQPDSFDLVIHTPDLLKSDKLKINLLPEVYFKNFIKQDQKPKLYNHVIVKYKTIGTMPLPGLYLSDYAPDQITFKGNTYVFEVKLK